MITRKQIVWTFAMGVAGLFLGLKGQDRWEDIVGTVLILFWFAGIGFGLGGIFSGRGPSRWIVVNWVVALAGLFPFVVLAFAAAVLPSWPHVPFVQQVGVGLSGACIGALLGIRAGTLHLRRLRMNSG